MQRNQHQHDTRLDSIASSVKYDLPRSRIDRSFPQTKRSLARQLNRCKDGDFPLRHDIFPRTEPQVKYQLTAPLSLAFGRGGHRFPGNPGGGTLLSSLCHPFVRKRSGVRQIQNVALRPTGALLRVPKDGEDFRDGASKMKTIGLIAMGLLGALPVLDVPAQAGTVRITYSFTGGLTAPPDLQADGLHLQASATGSVDEFNPVVNAAWNPVTFDTSDVLDLSTGLDNGTFTWSFANGDTLTGTMFEDDTAVNFATNTGPFLQNLTFTGGTGAFAGATGSSSGNGFLTAPTFSISGNGFLTAEKLVAVPEPGSMSLMFGCLLIMFLRYRRFSKQALPT